MKIKNEQILELKCPKCSGTRFKDVGPKQGTGTVHDVLDTKTNSIDEISYTCFDDWEEWICTACHKEITGDLAEQLTEKYTELGEIKYG